MEIETTGLKTAIRENNGEGRAKSGAGWRRGVRRNGEKGQVNEKRGETEERRRGVKSEGGTMGPVCSSRVSVTSPAVRRAA